MNTVASLSRLWPCAQSCCWSPAGSSGWWCGRDGGPAGSFCPWCSLPGRPTVPPCRTPGTRRLAWPLTEARRRRRRRRWRGWNLRGKGLVNQAVNLDRAVIKSALEEEGMSLPVLRVPSSSPFSAFPSPVSLSTSLMGRNNWNRLTITLKIMAN